MTVSSVTGKGIEELWKMIIAHRERLESTGLLAQRRRAQALDWMRELIATGLEDAFRKNDGVGARLPELEAAVQQGIVTPFAAARELLSKFRGYIEKR